VREVGPDGSYIVEIRPGAFVVARASARVLARGIDIEAADAVRVEVGADMKRGTITSIRRTTT
jgi:hypothetical protein